MPFFARGNIYKIINWSNILTLTSLTASMTVNALVTGLIVFRIFKVFRNSRGLTTSAEKSLGVTGGGKLRSIIFVIIESGMTLFTIQLARLAISMRADDAAINALVLIANIHGMFNVIILSVFVTLFY
jgi:hypothetical protein